MKTIDIEQLQEVDVYTRAYHIAKQAADEGVLKDSSEAASRCEEIRDTLSDSEKYMFDSFIKSMYPKSEEELLEIKREKVKTLFSCLFVFIVAPILIITGLYGVSALIDSIHPENASNGSSTTSSITPW